MAVNPTTGDHDGADDSGLGVGLECAADEPTAAAPGELLCRRPTHHDGGGRRSLVTWKGTYAVAFLVILCGFVALTVGWEVVAERAFPSMSTGTRHALLTIWATLVTSLAAGVVYLAMRRQQRRLARTAEQLTRLLESYQANPAAPVRFDNPHLVSCYEALGCEHLSCPVRESGEHRCWLVMAQRRMGGEQRTARIDLRQCLDCEVYRRSCPDRLTELGEAFNNVMFLLKTEAGQARRMRSQLVEREKMAAIGQIAAGVAHEVGNPLSSISSVVQMLKRAGSRGSTDEQLDLIDTHIRRISATVRQLVTLARPSSERWELVDIGQVLKEVVRLVSFDQRARNVDIVFEPPPTLPRTYGLRGELQQVFLNLVLNALDAMPDGGELRISARAQHRRITVRVADTGCGIAPESGRRIFELFFTTKPPGRGAGLGLAVSYGIVRKHDGVIDFEPSESGGAVFTVVIPVTKLPPEPENEQAHDSAGR